MGFVTGVAIYFQPELQNIFHTKNCINVYDFWFWNTILFIMSINRGLYQGKNMMNKLAFTHQNGNGDRLLLTITAAIYLPSYLQ
jgi:uncharacterized membrane protein YhaH (DUF805 family)